MLAGWSFTPTPARPTPLEADYSAMCCCTAPIDNPLYGVPVRLKLSCGTYLANKRNTKLPSPGELGARKTASLRGTLTCGSHRNDKALFRAE